MAKWKIEEASFESLTALNKYIAEKNIEPSYTIKYNTVFDQIKRTMKYIFTYWVKVED